MTQNLQKEYDFYLEHQAELAREHLGRVLVIKGEEVIGVFDSELEAVNTTKKEHELGTFLVQRVEAPGTTDPQTFHSRVTF